MKLVPCTLALLAVTAAAAAQSIVLPGDQASIAVPKQPVSMDLTAIDKSVNPCTDFYAYACGTWRKDNPIPADQTIWGRFTQLRDYNTYSVYALLQQAADHPTSPLQTRYGNYFAACMDTATSDKLGAGPIQPQLQAISALKDKASLAALFASLENQTGSSFLFGFGSQQDQKDSSRQIPSLGQAGISLPDRDYYLQGDDRMKAIRDQYVAHLTRMFTLLGDAPDKAAAEAQSVLKFETALAQGSVPRVDLRDPAKRYHIMSVADLNTTTPAFNWNTYFTGIKVPVSTLNVSTPTYFTALNTVLQGTSLDDIKTYLRWKTVHSVAGSLSTPFVDENFAFFGKTLNGQKEQAPLWKRCTSATDGALGEAVGQDWVARYFTPQAKANMQQLVKDLESALGDDIRNLDWMSAATKEEALKKLAAFRDKIGYPDTWRDYSSIAIKRDDKVGNLLHVLVYEDRRDFNKIGKPVDEKEWGMTPPTVNAYYSPANNDINFPAGILQPPFYDFKIDPAVNFGAIGVVIGHEMTHGFDDQGSKYDPQGNVRSWWTDADRTEFEKRTDCEVNEYGNFEVAPGQKLNGKLTLGENTADNGGLAVAYMALHKELDRAGGDAATKKIDGFTPDQRFFLGYAQLWCENTREETARVRAKTDPHSAGQYRVNGVVQNSTHFAGAFSCKQGDPMVPANACHVW